jgi:hypothetical protein
MSFLYTLCDLCGARAAIMVSGPGKTHIRLCRACTNTVVTAWAKHSVAHELSPSQPVPK